LIKYIIVFIGVMMVGCSTKDITYNSINYKDGKFKNRYIDYKVSIKDFFAITWEFMFSKPSSTIPTSKIPVVKITKKDIDSMQNGSVVRIGHSTLLLKIDDKLILTDPLFGERASPVGFMGPKRFHNTPIDIEQLPYIDVIIVSHNHYDHLDEYSIKRLKDKVGVVYTALGVGAKIIDFGVDSSKVVELDWWDSAEYDGIKFTATPAQHFSGRGIFDRDETLWSSWVITSKDTNIYFGADGGYFKGFKEIGDRLGPFDMAFLEVGAYNSRWQQIHMLPQQAIQANIDLNSKILYPIHNSTFDLSLHPWKEPLELITEYAEDKGINIVHPKIGVVVPMSSYTDTKKWWQDLE
jgi:L-ascorbate metabolism protein UlaG (beta-lactamase superfamily)